MEPSKSVPGLLQGQERALRLRLGAGCQWNIWWGLQWLWPAGWSPYPLLSLTQFPLPGVAVQGALAQARETLGQHLFKDHHYPSCLQVQAAEMSC